MSADLHMHSTASDGKLSPSELVELSYKKGLFAMAITDHDSVEGVQEAIKKSESLPIKVIPGVELSCTIDNRDVHVLGYWIDYQSRWLNLELKAIRESRDRRVRKIADKLKAAGMDVSYEEIKDIAGNAAIGRSHVARAMIRRGYVSNVQQAFDRYIGNDHPCYVEKDMRTPKETLELIRKTGGVSVLAHPGTTGIDEKIDKLKEYGLNGIEVYHPDHSIEKIKHYKNIAKKYDLVVTGGSDFHAKGSKRGIFLGTKQASLETIDKLKKVAKEVKKNN